LRELVPLTPSGDLVVILTHVSLTLSMLVAAERILVAVACVNSRDSERLQQFSLTVQSAVTIQHSLPPVFKSVSILITNSMKWSL
jgi:hypothetical protein